MKKSLVTIALFLSINLYAETIILKSGKIINGKVIDQHATDIVVRDNNGKVITYQKRLILKVVYRDLNKEQAEKVKKIEQAKLVAQQKEEAEKKRQEEERQKAEKLKEAELAKKQATTKDNDVSLEKNRLRKEKFGALWRSAVLPGWGQSYRGRTGEGFVIGTTFLLSAAVTNNKTLEMKKAAADYGNLNNPNRTFLPVFSSTDPIEVYVYNIPFERQQKAIDRHYRELRTYGVITLFYYSFNMIDAFLVSANSKKLERTSVMAKSAMLPGWGQIADGRRSAGYAYSSLFVYSLTSFALKYNEWKKAEQYRSVMNTYKTIPFLSDPNRQNQQPMDPVGLYFYQNPLVSQDALVLRLKKQANGFAALAVLVYALNIADAAIFHKSSSAMTSVLFDVGQTIVPGYREQDSYLRLGYLTLF